MSVSFIWKRVSVKKYIESVLTKNFNYGRIYDFLKNQY